MSAAKVSVIIVTYNSMAFIDRCLQPIYGAEDIEIVIVDNNSSDNTAEHIRITYPAVTLIASAINLGFAGGNNLAANSCTAPFVLLLNPDAFLDDKSIIDQLLGVIDQDPTIAMVGPMLKNIDGSHQTGDAGCSDTLMATAGHMLFIHKIFPTFPSLYITNSRSLNLDYVEVDWICGACLMTRRSVFETYGGLNEEIFMYGEDVEWGERMKMNGLRVVYAPYISVVHMQGATQRDGSTAFYSTKWLDNRALKWSKRSRIKFEFFRILCFLGLSLRAIGAKLLEARRGGGGSRSKNMARYAAHVCTWRYAAFAK